MINSILKNRTKLFAIWSCCVVLFATQQTVVAADNNETQLPYDLRPYYVRLELIFSEKSGFTPQGKSALLQQLSTLNSNTYGEMWKTKTVENKDLLPRTKDVLSRLTVEQLKAKYPQAETDKVFLGVVEKEGSVFKLAMREWDSSLETFSLIEEANVSNVSEVSIQLNQLVTRTFRPLCKIKKVDQTERKAYLTLRAGEFPALDSASAQVVVGDVFLPYLRYLDKKKQVKAIHQFDWNYFMVDKIDRGHLVCSVISGVRTPVGGRGLRRVDQVGIRVRPLRKQTDVRLTLWTQPDIPLVAHYVSSFLKKMYRDEAAAEPIRYLSDRRGIVSIPYNPEHPVQWLYVNSGSALLGRVPLIPGLVEEINCPLPDDSMRLEVEGKIEQLKGTIIEIIAKRSSVMAEIKVFVGKENWDEVDRLMAEFDQLDTASELKSQLNTIRVLSMEKAEKAGNPVGARRIDRLSQKTSQFIDRYLGEEKVRMFKENVAEDKAAILNEGKEEKSPKSRRKKRRRTKRE